jgi:hypothetical protein
MNSNAALQQTNARRVLGARQRSPQTLRYTHTRGLIAVISLPIHFSEVKSEDTTPPADTVSRLAGCRERSTDIHPEHAEAIHTNIMGLLFRTCIIVVE